MANALALQAYNVYAMQYHKHIVSSTIVGISLSYIIHVLHSVVHGKDILLQA